MPYPTAALFDERRRFGLIQNRGELVRRCEDCSTTTITQTYFVDQYGSSTSCTTTATRTAYHTNTIPPPTPTIPVQVETVYHTKISTLSAAVPTAAPTAPTPPYDSGQYTTAATPSWTPGLDDQGSSVKAQSCQCEQEWVKNFLGGLPHGAADVIAPLAFFFPFTMFFLVALVRLKHYAGDKEMFFFLVPLALFLGMMLSALATRAYASTSQSTPHYLAQHVMLSLAPSLLLDVALQLYGLLSKRVVPSGWIDASSLFLRMVNVIALTLYAVAAGSFVNFVNGWQSGTMDCSSPAIVKIAILNIVADVLEILLLVIGCILLFWTRWKLRMDTGALVVQYLLYAFFFFHFFWRAIHDMTASMAWKKRLDMICSPLPATEHSTYSDSLHRKAFNIDWSSPHKPANGGLDAPAPFWLLCILPIFLASALLMAANLPRYISATPQPVPEPDSVRYKLCYNEDTKKMEFVRLDNPGGPVLPSGEQLYELVRDHDGEGWAIQEARIPSLLPAWHNITFTPWYR